MDPISLIVTALALGVAAAAKPVAEQAVKDAYDSIKKIIQDRYNRVHLNLLEEDPASKAMQGVVEEDLKKVNAGQDEELLQKAQTLLDIIEKHAPEATGDVGIDLEALQSASLRIKNIIATGSFKFKARNVNVSGDIDVSDIQAGQGGSPRSPKPDR